MTTILMPMMGTSTRFPGVAPKWSLTYPAGETSPRFGMPMFRVALDHILPIAERCLLGVPDAYANWVEDVMADFPLPGVPVRVVTLDPTSDQVHTLEHLIHRANAYDDMIICRDCDSAFAPLVPYAPHTNFVAYATAQQAPGPIANKCFLQLGPLGMVSALQEKYVTSPFFGVGAYGFRKGQQFLDAAQQLRQEDPGPLYPSQLINLLLQQGEQFLPVPVREYEDFGTLPEWRAVYRQHGTLFVDLDGTLFSYTTRGTRHEVRPLLRNIAWVNTLPPGWEVIITTAREAREAGEVNRLLQHHNVRHSRVIFGLPRGPRLLINDAGASNAGQTARALTIPRDSDTLAELLDAP